MTGIITVERVHRRVMAAQILNQNAAFRERLHDVLADLSSDEEITDVPRGSIVFDAYHAYLMGDE